MIMEVLGILDLLITMLERLGIIVAVAFILTRFSFFQEMMHQDKLDRKQEVKAIIFFGLFGIMGTYLGVAFNTETLYLDNVAFQLSTDEAIANSRVIGIVIAGLLGGYKVGIGAGLISGIHRITLGGFTAVSCGLATILTGFLVGIFYKKKKPVKLTTAFFIGGLAEALQMGLILVAAKPFEKALTLVEIIGIPMILANGMGSAIFLLIVQNVTNEKEKISAQQAQRSLRIADQTLGYLRKGMNFNSADAVCQILYNEIKPSAVAMTNQSEILAHVGLASDHHQAGSPIQTSITKEVIQKGELIVSDHDSIHCKDKNCLLGVAIIAPLKQREKTIGTLKLYFRSEKEVTDVNIELVSGLSSLLSNQLEIADADKAFQLAKEAEIKSLQAQISPHFLFNSLNIIVSLIRTDQDKARQLLISLSQFLRQNLIGTTAEMVSLKQELVHVKAYLDIEAARFVDKLEIVYDINNHVLEELIPPLTLQPIVENAIKHGIKDMEEACYVKITLQALDSKTFIKIDDNGKGISQDRMPLLGLNKIESETGTGMGLYNVNRRLMMTFGDQASLKLESEVGKGTRVSFFLPKKEVIR